VKQPQLVKPRIFDSLQVGGGVRVLAYVIYLETKDIRQSVKSVQGLTREMETWVLNDAGDICRNCSRRRRGRIECAGGVCREQRPSH
jgi:hypothetical protein